MITSLIIGKFFPPSSGHIDLINFAKSQSDLVVILVDKLINESIDNKTRANWLHQHYLWDDKIKIISLAEPMPQTPAENSSFWQHWTQTIQQYTKSFNISSIIGSEDYITILATYLNIKPVVFDKHRQYNNISSTKIRDNLLLFSNEIIPEARKDLIPTYCLMGPESVGKSTIAKKIAIKLKTPFVPEYAKQLIISNNGGFDKKDIIKTIKQQQLGEYIAKRHNPTKIILDTDILSTQIWHDTLWSQDKYNYINKYSKNNLFLRHYFLFYPDTKWIPDIHRNLFNISKNPVKQINTIRINMFYQMKTLLEDLNLNYTIITGDYTKKEHTILNTITNHRPKLTLQI